MKKKKESILPLWAWIVFLLIGILLTMLFMYIVRKVEKLLTSSTSSTPTTPGQISTSSSSIMDSQVTCILVDVIIYLFFGMFLNPDRYPIWAIAIYAVVFEMVTQFLLSPYFPQFFCASWWKSIVDVILIIISYSIGQWLRSRAFNQGKQSQCNHNYRKCQVHGCQTCKNNYYSKKKRTLYHV